MKKDIDVELLEAIENFIDAKLGLNCAMQQKPFNHGVFEQAQKRVAEKKNDLHDKICDLTWVASAK